ncbi:MAG: MarR family transcriptional regulator [Myxococcota bacterium]
MADPRTVSDDLRRYVEDLALFYEAAGLPRIAGRILGLLLVCEPPHRTAAQLIEELGASKASVSQMTRLLVSAGLIERFAQRGERASYFRIRDDGFETLFEREIATIRGFGPIADRGLALLGPEAGDRGSRLRALRALYRFFEEAMPDLIDRWRRERDERIANED